MVSQASAPLRCVSVDVEDYFHIEAAHGRIAREDWDRWPLRVERNVDLLLQLHADTQRRGTWFILGWVARKLPHLARRIADAGHEIASHGTMHDRLHRLTADTFRDDLLASKRLLEDQGGQAVVGYRAPTFSVVRQTAWAIDVLVNAGFHYDASIFPVRHHWYGVPEAPDRPFFVRGPGGGTILEAPPLTLRTRGRNVPVAGGGYFRLLPLWFMKRGLRQSADEGRPAVLYFHPWEFDPDFPRMPLSLTGRLRTYTGLKRASARLRTILKMEGRWQTMGQSLEEWRQEARQRPVFALG
jgi:polysaccharide deacetylase family protein (PEP-CTERM system associated)